MKKFQRMTALLLALGTVLALAACGGKTEQPATDAPAAGGDDTVYTITMGGTVPDDHPISQGQYQFEKIAEELSFLSDIPREITVRTAFTPCTWIKTRGTGRKTVTEYSSRFRQCRTRKRDI